MCENHQGHFDAKMLKGIIDPIAKHSRKDHASVWVSLLASCLRDGPDLLAPSSLQEPEHVVPAIVERF